jgi:hypothetical protein
VKRNSSWFVFATIALLGVLTVGIISSYLLLLRQSSRMRIGVLKGSSMEPALCGPRIDVQCAQCQVLNSWTVDAWDSSKEVRCQYCKEYLDTSRASFADGQAVAYLPSLLWKLNSKTIPIRRWDILVIGEQENLEDGGDSTDESQAAAGQLKRVVGLPGEAIAIRDGRIWANGKPVLPTPEEFMQQGILVSSWSASASGKSLSEYIATSTRPIDNELPLNAQDSHQRIAVRDIGIAFRFSKPQSNWKLKLSLIHGSIALPIHLFCHENHTEVEVIQASADQSRKIEAIRDWKPLWINLILLGDRLIVLDEKKQQVAIDLDPLEDGLGWSDLEWIEPEGLIDRCMIYRGIHFRGANDSPEQEFPASDGWIVLGDNVSISADSRIWEHQRVPLVKIRGLLKHRLTLMEGLVKQLP